MDKQAFLNHCLEVYGVKHDCPFSDDFGTSVLRHKDNKKWFALIMEIPKRKLGVNSDKEVWVVNLKLPLEMKGVFCENDGVYPAYHMNKLHWISVVLQDADDETVKFLTDLSFEATKSKKDIIPSIN